MKLNVTLLLVALSLSACGLKKETKDKEGVTSFRLSKGETLSKYVKTISLDSETPEGLGTLLSLNEGLYNERNAGLCTWFLIDETRVMTNSHCIPEALKEDKDLNCGEYLQGHIKTSSGSQIVTCKKLLHFSTLSELTVANNDYALIELNNKVNLSKTYQLDRIGINENDKVNVLTMTHHQTSSGIYSEFIPHKCLIKSSDSWGRVTSPGTSPLTGFKEENSDEKCKTVGGNSGSPVTNDSGSLVGILHGGMKEGENVRENSEIESSSMTNDISILTNLRCQKFNDNFLDANFPPDCAEETKQTGMDQERVLKEFEPKLRKSIADALANQPDFLEYNIASRSFGAATIYSFSPKCVKPIKDWKEESVNLITSDSMLSKSKTIVADVTQYLMKFKISLDYYGNVKLDHEFNKTGTIKTTLKSLEKFDKSETVPASTELDVDGEISTYKHALPKCTKPVEEEITSTEL